MARHSGKKIAIALGVGLPLIAVFLVGFWRIASKPDGEVLAEFPLESGRVALRQGFRERGYVDLVVEEGDGSLRWHEPLFGVQERTVVANTESDLVVLRVFEARGNPAVHAFSLSNGEFQWRVPLNLESDPTAPSLRAQGANVIVLDVQGELELAPDGSTVREEGALRVDDQGVDQAIEARRRAQQ